MLFEHAQMYIPDISNMFENTNLIFTALVAFVSALKLLQCYRSYDSIVGNNVCISILSILIFMYIVF